MNLILKSFQLLSTPNHEEFTQESTFSLNNFALRY